MTLSMSKEKLLAVLERYPFAVFSVDDLETCLCLVRDLFEEEADAIRESEPYATRTIERYESVAREISLNYADFCELYEEESK